MPMTTAEATAQLLETNPMFALGEAEVAGVPMKVWQSCPASLRSILELSRIYGEATFLVYEDERATFEEHFQQVAGLARALAEDLGVRRGDRVAIAMRNLPEWVVAFWAVAAVGAVVVPLNAWWTGPELVFGLLDSGSRVGFVDGERLERLGPHLDELHAGGLGHLVVARESAELDMPQGVMHFGELFTAGDELPEVEIDPEDDATIFYTSGTTGRPKGAVGTQRNICTNLLSLGFVAARSALLATDTQKNVLGGSGKQNAYLLSVPLFHATGCHSILVANTAVGGKLVMMRRWNPERALELIEREKITIFGGVPTMVLQVLDSPDFSSRDTSTVRTVGYGGAPAPPDLVRRIKEHFPGGSPSNGYGLTETSSVTTMNAGDDYVRKPDSVGPPVPVCEVRVVDSEGADAPLGETGELWIRGPNVVRGYWHRPEETEAAFGGGWFRTGDLARLDDEGFVYIVDRAKDMVIRGGENVYSVEVESAIFEHPAVADAAVIGVPHELLGEEVGAAVLLRPGASLTAEELRDHVRQRIAGFKVPAHIWFRDEPLPRNPAGKVLKRALREEMERHLQEVSGA
jgi:long-chain acyl-CoA synthetase